MPTYVYKCDSCGSQFEQFQSFKDEPIRTCPSCAGAVRRVFQPVGIVFKGSGWYITDSRKSSSATVGTSDDASKTDSAKGGEAKSGEAAKTEAPASASPASDSAASTSASSSTTA